MSLNERGMKSGCIPYLPLSDLLWVAQELISWTNGLAIQGQSQNGIIFDRFSVFSHHSRSSDKVTRLPLDSQMQRDTTHLFEQLQLSLEEGLFH
jgi:hypothetical protein